MLSSREAAHLRSTPFATRIVPQSTTAPRLDPNADLTHVHRVAVRRFRRRTTAHRSIAANGAPAAAHSRGDRVDELGRPFDRDRLGGDENEHKAVVERAHVGLGDVFGEARVDEESLQRLVAGDAAVLAAV
jgi:hypothetical protein